MYTVQEMKGRGELCNYECEALLHVGGAKRASLSLFFQK
jgi:hypothetical protein